MLAIRRALNDSKRCQDVVAHRLVFCENALLLPMDHLLLDCWCCQRFLAYCCSCTARHIQAEEARQKYRSHSTDDPPPYKPCHYYKVALVDGACLGNGQDRARAGIGIAIGVHPRMQWALPIDDLMDPVSVRASQRAELLAAIHGICKLAEFETHPSDKRPKAREVHANSDSKITWVITSDLEYVVSGMTEWVPNWKSDGWHNSSGMRPKNLDLFQRLDATVDNYEYEYGVRIAFWRISRVHNELADELAGLAARGNTIDPVQSELESDDGMSSD